MKKNILIVIPAMISGGVEVSLVKFLKYLSKDKNLNIDLCLFERGGVNYKLIPNNVNIIDVNYKNDIYNFNNGIKDIIKYKGILKIKFLFFRILLKLKLLNDNWQGYYSLFLKKIIPIKKEYDLAIDYRGYGHLSSCFLAEKVNAKKKIMWLHDEKINWFYRVRIWIKFYDKFYCVSKAVMNKVSKEEKEIVEKLDIFYNLIDFEDIKKKSKEKVSIKFENCLNIVTCGRLEEQKGYDIAVKIAKILDDNNIKFKWYILGDGSLKNDINKMISDNNLNDNFELLGNISNPFPYIKNADLYVQPSRHEGYGIAIAEARVLGVIPIATNLECVKEQITDGANGFLCDLDEKIFANKIISLINNKKMYDKIKENLKKDNFDFTYQFDKFYKLMEE